MHSDAEKAATKTTTLSRSERIDQLQQMAAQQNILSILNDRVNTQQQLVALYGRWGRQVEIQRKIVIHLLLQSLAFIAAICALTILIGWALQVALEKFLREHRQRQTLKTVVNLGSQLVGLLLVLLVVFGVPRQMPTILGLATAGLTVVFQDFILAFCGWFVLMGPNGIRVRDWVEIDGVGGEVVQLGIFRTWPPNRTKSVLPKRLRHPRKVLQLLHRRPMDVGRDQGQRSTRNWNSSADREDLPGHR